MLKVYTITWKYKKKYKRRLYVDSKMIKNKISVYNFSETLCAKMYKTVGACSKIWYRGTLNKVVISLLYSDFTTIVEDRVSIQ